MATTPYEKQLRADIGSFFHDPLQYALYNWPNLDLRQWQVEYLREIGARLHESPYEPIQTATASGHGIGKGCCGAIVVHWAMSTREMTRGVVTANTDTQLRTKTWPELAKWHAAARNKHWFACTATSLYHPLHEKNWRVDAIPWSESNTEAFAGLHNKGSRIILWFDEASAIHDKIWEVSEGALTDEDTEILWIAKGNPTRTVGRFKDCFGKFKHRWIKRHIDARTVEGTNKVQLARYIDDYGEDSDFCRVRVRGLFPRASAMQFIDSDMVEKATKREALHGLRDPLIMSVDVARGGADEYVIAYRRGMDARSIPWVCIPGAETRDSTKVIAKIVDLAVNSRPELRPDAIFVDETGIGGPIVDRLRQLLGDAMPVYGVSFSGSSRDKKLANARMFIWWQMREAFRNGLAIPDDTELTTQLTAPEFHHDKHDRLILEDKDTMRERIGVSPDRADALAIGFYMPVAPREDTVYVRSQKQGAQQTALGGHDPYAGM